jgi:exodeoxyribonuclease VII small subunit
MSEKKNGLEDSMARLEAIVSELEEGEHTLEESLKKFEEGLELGKRCRKILDQADMRIRKLVDVDEDGNPVTEEFEDEG